MRKHTRTIFVLALLALAALSAPVVGAQETPPAGGGQSSPPAQGQRPRFNGVAGTITSLDKDTFVLHTFDGKTVTVKLTGSTRYRRDRQEAKYTDFKVGEMVDDAAGRFQFPRLGLLIRAETPAPSAP